jgi:tetratricopeptide (TPR) repeat protein
MAALAAATPALAQAPAAFVKDIKVYERDAWSRKVTQCDELASHPDDPEKVAPGVTQNAVALNAAIGACTKALKTDPDNPRLNYQLARAYGYSGRHAEGAPYRQKALLAGYPQSLFVVGWINVTGWGGSEKDVCTGAELIRKSAHAGRQAGLIGFPHYVVNGTFGACPVAKDKAEMLAFLERAEKQAPDFYQRVAIELLREDVTRLP